MLVIGNDHAATELKINLLEWLSTKGVKTVNVGTDANDSVDYPDFAKAVCKEVQASDGKLGLLMCGSGNGIAISANKHKGIRAAICWNKELAELARQHNNANVLVLPARFITEETAKECIEAFLATDFEGGRHERRVNKIENE